MSAINSRTNEYRNRNAGFSLVELIVTVAILALVAGIGLMTYQIVNNSNVRKTTVLVNDMMNECRQQAKAKANTSWGIRMDYSENGLPSCAIYQGSDNTPYDQKQLAAVASLKISYPVMDDEGNSSKTEIKIGPANEGYAAQYVGITYVKLSGKIASISVGSTDIIETELPEKDYYDFIFTRKNQVYTIRLYRTTGKQEFRTGLFED